jgi:hypothetical protein
VKRLYTATFFNVKTKDTREEEIAAVNTTQAAMRGETIFIRDDELLTGLLELD